MRCYSTARQSEPVSIQAAIMKGLAPDGGLYMPETIPLLSKNFFENLSTMSFQDIAWQLARPYLEDEVAASVLEEIVHTAINFDAPLVRLADNLFILELFHGPTLAFKDFGARFMARLMSHFCRGEDSELTILVATSGDTGSAVAHGFYNVAGINVVVLYPSGKVSELQEKQLTTMGGNITTLEVQGTFDDCQKLVKTAFVDQELAQRMQLSSANSISIARLLPQTFYYVYGFGQLRSENAQAVFSVPSGNFGNLTAALFAKHMGLPVQRFIAATNVNDVVPQYLKSGVFEPRASVQTISNAMDVGAPSNFARIQDLYKASQEALCADVWGSAYTDDETKAVIKSVFDQYRYTLDPHGAVGFAAFSDYLKEEPTAKGIIVETAHPAKFIDVVETVLGIRPEIPERLASCMSKAKQATLISTEFEPFKELLLNRSV
ncbi:threonine synthase [Oligoflexia bacterium]|nr:threonine synthase [Oligoflexia bacterium]